MKQILLCRDCDKEIGTKEVESKEELRPIHSDMLCEECAQTAIPEIPEKSVTDLIIEESEEKIRILEEKIITLEGRESVITELQDKIKAIEDRILTIEAKAIEVKPEG